MILYKTNCYLYTALIIKNPAFLEEKFSDVSCWKKKDGSDESEPTFEIAASLRSSQ